MVMVSPVSSRVYFEGALFMLGECAAPLWPLRSEMDPAIKSREDAPPLPPLEDELGEVGVAGEAGEVGVYVGGVYGDGVAGFFGGVEGDVVEEAFEDGLEAACADVFDRVIDLDGEIREAVYGAFVEGEGDVFSGHESFVLLDQAGFRLDQNAAHIIAGERV